MTDKKKNGWIKFVPSLDLPKERVSIAYDTHDERGVRYAYGYFQFHNGTCGCFWKDGNEQPKVIKAEDIKYWMLVHSLDMQEEPVSEDLDEAAKEWLSPQLDKSYAKYGEAKMMELTKFDGYAMLEAIEFGAKWKEEQFEKNRLEHCNSITNEQAELEQKFLDEHLDKYNRMPTFLDAIEYGMRLQKEQMMKNAVECEYFDGSLFCNDLREKYRDCDKVKVIVIKED